QLTRAFEDGAVGVDAQKVVGCDLVPEHAHAGDDQRAVLAVAHADVAGELVVVALHGKRAAGDGHLLALRESVGCVHGESVPEKLPATAAASLAAGAVPYGVGKEVIPCSSALPALWCSWSSWSASSSSEAAPPRSGGLRTAGGERRAEGLQERRMIPRNRALLFTE